MTDAYGINQTTERTGLPDAYGRQVRIAGVNDGSNVPAGQIGEVVSASGAGVALTTAIPANIASVILTAGDWEVYGSVSLASSTSVGAGAAGGISTTSGALPPVPNYFLNNGAASLVQYVGAVPTQRLNLAVTTTVYLVGQLTFATGVGTGAGVISARRMR
jgi:hypothetical protein